MIYLIQEETSSYIFGTTARTVIKGYYECDSEAEVKAFCTAKTNKIKGTYDEDSFYKTYLYTELSKLN